MNYIKRLLLLVIGASLMALGGSLLILSNIGGDAIIVFQQGFSFLIGFSADDIGYGILIINVILTVVMVIMNRKMLNVGTIVVVLLMGPFVQLVLTFNLINEATELINQIIMSLIACLVVSIGVSLYIHANLGYAPFEGILITIQKKFNVRFAYVKLCADVILFILGWLMGGVIGLGSVLTIIIFGPTIDFFMKLINKIIPKKSLGYE